MALQWHSCTSRLELYNNHIRDEIGMFCALRCARCQGGQLLEADLMISCRLSALADR
jgi:hypothetical protein